MGPLNLILFLLVISAEGILAINPCNQTFTGSVQVNPDDIPHAVTNCTFQFIINSATDTLMLDFSSLSRLKSQDNITISAESKTIFNITSGNDPVTVVSTSNVTVVTFLREAGSQGTFKLNYANECYQTVNPLSGILFSPKYMAGTNKPIKCTYNVTSPEGQSTLLGFASFTLKPSSNLTVDGEKVTVVVKPRNLPDDLLLLSGASIVLTLNNDNTSKTQEEFTSFLWPVNSDCSHSINVTDRYQFSYTPSTSGGVCHLMINGSSVTLVSTVTKWQIDSEDQLQLRDGVSQLDNLISGSLIQRNMMFVTSGSKMNVHLTFVPISTPRQVEIEFISQASGGLVKVGDNIAYNSTMSGGKDAVFQCTLDAGKKVSLTNFKMTNNGKVEVYDGNVIEEPVFTITAATLSVPVFMKSSQMTIVAKNSIATYAFNATTGEAQRCDQFSSLGLGSYAVSAGPNDTYTCNLVISPSNTTGYSGTLQLTSLSLCGGDVVTIIEGSTKTLFKFTNSTKYLFIPQIIFDAGKGVRIETVLSKCDKRNKGDVVVTASFDMKTLSSLCGEQPSSPSGTVLSPNYPLRYPLNLNCPWTFQNKTDSSLYISVDNLDIKVGNSLKLTGDMSQFNFTAETLKRDLIFNKNKDLILSFTYDSQDGSLVIPGDGFNISYRYLDCGGNITTNFSELLGGNKTDCRWIINLPQTPKDSTLSNKTAYIIKAMLNVTENYKTGSLIVYDGTSMKDEHRMILTISNLTFLSRADSFIIQYINNDMKAKTFTLTVKINSYLCTNFCTNLICMHEDWKCNGINDCGDNSDEVNCTEIIPPTPSPQPSPQPAPQPDKGGVPGFWLAVMLIIGLIVGVLLPFIIPAIVRRVRKRNYNRMTDMGNPEA